MTYPTATPSYSQGFFLASFPQETQQITPPQEPTQIIRDAVEALRQAGYALQPNSENIDEIKEQRRHVVHLSTEAVTALMQTLKNPDNGEAIGALLNKATPTTQLRAIIHALNLMDPDTITKAQLQATQRGTINERNYAQINERAFALLSEPFFADKVREAILNLPPEKRSAFIAPLFPSLSAKDTAALIPSQAILSSTYIKLMTCASLATFLFPKAIQSYSENSLKSHSTKLLALGSAVSSAITLAPIAFGLRNTENCIHVVEKSVKDASCAAGSFMKTKATQLKRHVAANQTTYLRAVSTITAIAIGGLAFKKIAYRPQEIAIPTQIAEVAPLPVIERIPPPPPEPNFDFEYTPANISTEVLLTKESLPPFIRRTVEQVVRGTILDPIIRMGMFANTVTKTLAPYASYFIRDVIPDLIRSEEVAKGRI